MSAATTTSVIPAAIRAPAPLFKDILAYCDRSASSVNALDYARALAEAGSGKLTALMVAMFSFHSIGMYGEGATAVWIAARAQAETEAAALEADLRSALTRIAPEAEFRRSDAEVGDGPDRFAEIGRYFDASVLGFDAEGGSDLQRRLFNAALFYSARPVIVVPQAAAQRGAPERVLVAWSPTREASRAVHDALPLLRGAEEVRIVVVDDARARAESGEPGADIAAHLARHGCAADVRFVPAGAGGVTSVLLDEARHFGADLIVLGGYGHSRLSQWMLGGVSRDIVARSAVPLLFSH